MSAQVLIRIPTPLRGYVGGADEVALQADTVGEALQQLARQYDGLGERILDAHAQPRQFVNIFVGKTDIRSQQGLATQVRAGDVIAIVPAVAGGRCHESER
ncbi:MAG TPA: MoaD/ThiS family protein [Ideonella sp.]|jgi:molybdopterin converting factor small subunit|nr:MoaD/ThiS family protein [Ideonella sp.]